EPEPRRGRRQISSCVTLPDRYGGARDCSVTRSEQTELWGGRGRRVKGGGGPGAVAKSPGPTTAAARGRRGVTAGRGVGVSSGPGRLCRPGPAQVWRGGSDLTSNGSPVSSFQVFFCESVSTATAFSVADLRSSAIFFNAPSRSDWN